ncbi:spore coat protein [Desulfuribacillus stibiiarsenatis]|uniref:Spore coat protein n=1 Tax=Desulfuribacillus stibiiarsenatis TaxID=1390249 RepID=A0A1E5L8D2_9FIRM|nr:FG-GAP-like repeat-containing protein [Desulfuribacillus stibiiarsenatis]OEH86410.1 spore coat protein [Desulfuribacillus stibiiarsenatis]
MHIQNNDQSAQTTIIAVARGDVNGDLIPDNVYLTGTQDPSSPFIQNITLIIENGNTGAFTRIPLKENANAGYNPTLFLGDFTGDGVDDILISINSGGSGGMMYHYIYSFTNNKSKLLFNFEVYNEQYKYTVTYQNNYKVKVVSLNNNKTFIIDISDRGAEYLNEIYDANGNLKAPITGFVNPISGMYPVDFDGNGVYELLAYQRIAGRYNADSLGYVLNTLHWKNDRFALEQQNVAIFGSQNI